MALCFGFVRDNFTCHNHLVPRPQPHTVCLTLNPCSLLPSPPLPPPSPLLPPSSPAPLQFRRVYQVVLGYVAGELSALYLDTSKDRCYIQAPGSATRRACQTVQAVVLKVGGMAGGAVCVCGRGGRGVQQEVQVAMVCRLQVVVACCRCVVQGMLASCWRALPFTSHLCSALLTCARCCPWPHPDCPAPVLLLGVL